MKYFKYSLIFIVVILATNCEKEQRIADREYPVLLTEEAVVSEKGAVLNAGFLTEFKKNEIKELGFIIWKTGSKKKHTINLQDYSEKFSYLLNHDIIEGESYSIKAYVRTSSFFSYGNTISFISQGFLKEKPLIHSFSPARATDNTVISLHGENFSFFKDSVRIFVEEKNAEILKSSGTFISFKLPVLTAGEKKIKLRVYRDEVEFGPITVQGPFIKEFFPKRGYDLSKITIIGSYFGNNPQVLLDTLPTNVLEANDSLIEISIPRSPIKGEVEVIVNVSHRSITADEKFNLLGPEITAISQNEGKIGDKITIEGKHFIQDHRHSSVMFNDEYTSIIYQTENEIILRVPNFRWSNATITVKNGLKNSEQISFKKIPSWEKLDYFPGNTRKNAVGIGLGSDAYVGLGGNEKYSNDLIDWWKFSPAEQKWTSLSDFPGNPAEKYCSYTFNNKIYLISIFYDHYELWEYDPEYDTWMQKETSFPVSEYNKNVSLAKNQDKIFVLFQKRFFSYDPLSNTWQELEAPDATPLAGFCFPLENWLYWFMVNRKNELELHRYHPTDHYWTKLETYEITAFNRDQVLSFTLNQKGYFGIESRNYYNYLKYEFYEFDPETQLLIRKENFHEYRTEQTSFVVNNTGYVGLGLDSLNVFNRDIWKFLP